MTRIVHCERDAYTVYIGHYNPSHSLKPSRWANPYRVGRDGTRAEVIEKYRRRLWAQVQAGDVRIDQLAGLYGETLGCWCAPKPCHGEVLAEAAAWAVEQLTEGAA
jgi:hypothetical protein